MLSTDIAEPCCCRTLQIALAGSIDAGRQRSEAIADKYAVVGKVGKFDIIYCHLVLIASLIGHCHTDRILSNVTRPR